MNTAQQEATEEVLVDHKSASGVRLTFLIFDGCDFFVERSALVSFHQLNKLNLRCAVRHKSQKKRDGKTYKSGTRSLPSRRRPEVGRLFTLRSAFVP